MVVDAGVDPVRKPIEAGTEREALPRFSEEVDGAPLDAGSPPAWPADGQ